jgi:outer membrane protein TolC
MLAQQKEELLELLGHPADLDIQTLTFSFPLPEPEGLKLDQPALLAGTLDVLPEYQQARLEIEQRSLGTELARRQYFPDYTLGAGYKVMHGMQDSFTASIEVPLLTHKEERQDAAVEQAYAQQRTAEDRLGIVPNRLQRELANLQSELDMHGDLVARYRTAVVPQARLTVESMLEAYASGMMQLDEVVMALQAALDAENEYEQQRIHYVHVLADLQVLTAGVFDPAPHLAFGLDAASPGGQALGESVGGLVIPVLPEQSSAAVPGAAAAPAPFVQELALPDPAPAEPDPPATDPVPPGAPPAADHDFYRPFVPQGGRV